MKTLFTVPLLICVLFAIANSPCLGFVSFGDVSAERAAELGLEVSSKENESGALQIKIEFKTEGELKVFREAKRGNRIELRIGGPEKPETVAALREDRSTAGRLIVHFLIARAQIDRASVWIIRPVDGIADIVRLKDFVDLKNTPAAAVDLKADEKDKAKP